MVHAINPSTWEAVAGRFLRLVTKEFLDSQKINNQTNTQTQMTTATTKSTTTQRQALDPYPNLSRVWEINDNRIPDPFISPG